MSDTTRGGTKKRGTTGPTSARVGIIMGSRSDWTTMKHAADLLDELGVSYEKKIVSAHRTPDLLFAYAEAAAERGLQIIIAGAGGAAHLPGMAAAKTRLRCSACRCCRARCTAWTRCCRSCRCPRASRSARSRSASRVAVNAALLAVAILALNDAPLARKLDAYRDWQTSRVLGDSLP